MHRGENVFVYWMYFSEYINDSLLLDADLASGTAE